MIIRWRLSVSVGSTLFVIFVIGIALVILRCGDGCSRRVHRLADEVTRVITLEKPVSNGRIEAVLPGAESTVPVNGSLEKFYSTVQQFTNASNVGPSVEFDLEGAEPLSDYVAKLERLEVGRLEAWIESPAEAEWGDIIVSFRRRILHCEVTFQSVDGVGGIAAGLSMYNSLIVDLTKVLEIKEKFDIPADCFWSGPEVTRIEIAMAREYTCNREYEHAALLYLCPSGDGGLFRALPKFIPERLVRKLRFPKMNATDKAALEEIQQLIQWVGEGSEKMTLLRGR